MTEGASSASEQVQRRRREAAVSTGQRLYEQNTKKNIELTFSFDKDQPIQDVEALARKIAELAQRVDGGENGQIRKDVLEDIPELDFVYLYARELQFTAKWKVGQGHRFGVMSTERLTSIVKEKEAKARHYGSFH